MKSGEIIVMTLGCCGCEGFWAVFRHWMCSAGLEGDVSKALTTDELLAALPQALASFANHADEAADKGVKAKHKIWASIQ